MISGINHNQETSLVINQFNKNFSDTSNSILFFSPASIVFLGDHTHYNEGLVISAAIDKHWIFLIQKRKDREINIVSADSSSILKTSLDSIDDDYGESFKFLRGLIKILKEEKMINNGFNCVISKAVPNCIGLGSSASQQIGFLNSIRKLFALNIDDDKLLGIARTNELNIIGKISNAAHHYTVQYAKKNTIFFIDLKDNHHKTFPIDSDEYSIVICDTGEPVINPEKICNERINECEIGIKGLRLYIWGIKSLRYVEMDFLNRHLNMLPRMIYNKVLYNVKERILVGEALKVLRKKSLNEFGNLVNQSHKNLSDDYDLKNELCNFLVEEAMKLGIGCSKMICCSPINSTVSLIHNDDVEYFRESITHSFHIRYKKKLRTYVAKLSGGVKKISLKKLVPA